MDMIPLFCGLVTQEVTLQRLPQLPMKAICSSFKYSLGACQGRRFSPSTGRPSYLSIASTISRRRSELGNMTYAVPFLHYVQHGAIHESCALRASKDSSSPTTAKQNWFRRMLAFHDIFMYAEVAFYLYLFLKDLLTKASIFKGRFPNWFLLLAFLFAAYPVARPQFHLLVQRLKNFLHVLWTGITLF
ncbi:hypothetical protein ACHQM5_022151 [Ranunculus cassubicifolius]